jgi:ankyrin repeat protein
MNPLIQAVQNVDLELVLKLLQNNYDPQVEHNQPLLSACQGGGIQSREIIQALVKYGADVHARNDLALSLAIQYRDIDKVKLLLHLGEQGHIYPFDQGFFLEKFYKIKVNYEKYQQQ